MSASTLVSPETFVADPLLLNAATKAMHDSLTMCNAKVRCVGVATVPVREPGAITGIIGVHGDVSGFVTLNLAEAAARTFVGGLLQDRFERLSSQVIDGVGELTNMLVGGIKRGLAGSPWAFSHVTVPSVIMGRSYQIAFTKGLQYFSTVFEHETEESLLLDDRLLQVTIALMRL
jgi:chemotaxis protein CheX